MSEPLDPDEIEAMQYEADRLVSERQHAEHVSENKRLLEQNERYCQQIDRHHQETLAFQERQHEEHMARLDRIAAALERLAERP